MPRVNEESPTYDQLRNRSRMLHTQSFAFSGTKLDLTKGAFGNSVFTLSNTPQGLSMNYVLNALRHAMTFSVYSNGSVLGKISPNAAGGASFTWMKSPDRPLYFDLEVTKTSSIGSLTLKAIRPEIDKEVFDVQALYNAVSNGKTKRAPEHAQKIKEAAEQPGDVAGALRNRAAKCREIFKVLKGGVFSGSAVAQLSSTLHAGVEHIVSLDKIRDAYHQNALSSCFIAKAFGSWRVLAALQSTGRAEIAVEKALENSVTLFADLSMDVREIRRRKSSIMDSAVGIAGMSVTGYSVSTKVSASTEGVVGAVSDVCIADGAMLNLSAQVSSVGSQIGVGFTIVG